MIARLQQRITLGLVLLAAAWAAGWWHQSAAVAVGGALALLFGHAFFLALECVAMVRVNRGDPAPRATTWQVLRAWLHESVTAPRVFCWRQPFRAQAVPDHLPADGSATGRRGVVLVHGLVCNRGFWTPWLRQLRQQGRPFVALSLEPVSAPIDSYVPALDAAVVRVTAATGQPPVLLCHSMGGLVARAWLRAAGDDSRVHCVVTVATPHDGTWLGRFGRDGSSAQMRLSSDWLAALAAAEPASRRARFVCWYSNCDNVVFPASTATLPGADNRLVPGLPHIALAFDPDVVRATLTLIEGGPASRR
ncbi:MAG: alpha/beta fold hydrolase [Pseudomonadota bacterium]